jgi:general transcription factor IIIA
MSLVAAEASPNQNSSSDDSDDYKTKYTDNGEKRADSEARRQWNYVCPVLGCDQRFNRPCRLESHMRSHSKERPFACPEPECDKTFPRKDHLQRHVKNAHSDPVVERTYTCDWRGCGKSFTSNGRLQRHREAHESKFYCTGYASCNEAFRKEKALEAHIKSQHLEVKPYPCTFVDPESGERCTNGYQTDGALQRHVSKVHTAEKENGLFCMVCAELGTEGEVMELGRDKMIAVPKQLMSFATQEELTAHVKQCHPPECVECGQKFKSESTLKSHVDTIHADPALQPKFPCPNPDCDSIFNRKHNLTVHIQAVHDKQTKFLCTSDAVQNSKHDDLKAWNGANACGDAFKAKSSLDQHIRTHHLGLGNRKQRRKAAKSKKKPKASMLSMLTGVGYEKNRDVPCLAQPCDYRFYMDRDLRRHLRAVHHISEDEIEEMIAERDALTGGQFWIGGLDESLSIFESTEPSMPQTPVPYFINSALPPPLGVGGEAKLLDQQLSFFDRMRLFDEEAQMDVAMGLGDLAPAEDVQQGLQWEMLEPVEQFNTDHVHG